MTKEYVIEEVKLEKGNFNCIVFKFVSEDGSGYYYRLLLSEVSKEAVLGKLRRLAKATKYKSSRGFTNLFDMAKVLEGRKLLIDEAGHYSQSDNQEVTDDRFDIACAFASMISNMPF